MSLLRSQARVLLPSLIEQGMNTSKALNYLKGVGLGYRRKEFLSDFRFFKGVEKSKEVFKYIRKDLYPSQDSYVSGKVYGGRKYSYNVKLEGYDEEGNWQGDSYVTLTSDANRRIQDIEDDAKLLYGDIAGGGYINATTATVQYGVFNEDYIG